MVEELNLSYQNMDIIVNNSKYRAMVLGSFTGPGIPPFR